MHHKDDWIRWKQVCGFSPCTCLLKVMFGKTLPLNFMLLNNFCHQLLLFLVYNLVCTNLFLITLECLEHRTSDEGRMLLLLGGCTCYTAQHCLVALFAVRPAMHHMRNSEFSQHYTHPKTSGAAVSQKI